MIDKHDIAKNKSSRLFLKEFRIKEELTIQYIHIICAIDIKICAYIYASKTESQC